MEPVRKVINFDVKEIGDPADRVLRFIGSDETEDRDDDIIEVAGWELKNFRKNPVILFGHDYREPAVGKAIKVFKDLEARQLVFDVKFPTIEELSTDITNVSEHAKFVDTLYNLYKHKYMRATSVGFIPLKSKRRDDDESLGKPEYARGHVFLQQELLELSLVPVPSNPSAVGLARSKGIDVQPMLDVIDCCKESAVEITRKEDESERRFKCNFCSEEWTEPVEVFEQEGGLIVPDEYVGEVQDELDEQGRVQREAGKSGTASEVTVETVTEEREVWTCPHCQEEIREKSLFWDREKDLWYHRPCKDDGPIILPTDPENEFGKRLKEHGIELIDEPADADRLPALLLRLETVLDKVEKLLSGETVRHYGEVTIKGIDGDGAQLVGLVEQVVKNLGIPDQIEGGNDSSEPVLELADEDEPMLELIDDDPGGQEEESQEETVEVGMLKQSIKETVSETLREFKMNLTGRVD